jgi:hypothetical protein
LLIECANIAEQSCDLDGFPSAWMSRVISWSRLLKRGTLPLPFHSQRPLTANAERKALEKYRHMADAPVRKVCTLLNEVIGLNPWAGEPRLLRALCHLQAGQKDLAFSDAVQGHYLLSAWAVSWDKRWRLNKWFALSAAILNESITANHRRNEALTIETVRNALLQTEAS